MVSLLDYGDSILGPDYAMPSQPHNSMPPPPQMRFIPMQMQQPQQQQQKGNGLLSKFLTPSNVSSLFGMGGTGGANAGDVAHNYIGGLFNPASDPAGTVGMNSAAGLNYPELTGEEMTNLVGGGGSAGAEAGGGLTGLLGSGGGGGVASSSALDGMAGGEAAGGLSGLFGGGGDGALGAAGGAASLFAALIGMGKTTEANHPDTVLGKGLLGFLGPSISQVIKDPVGMGLPTLMGASFLTPFTSSKEAQATKPEWSGLFNMGF